MFIELDRFLAPLEVVVSAEPEARYTWLNGYQYFVHLRGEVFNKHKQPLGTCRDSKSIDVAQYLGIKETGELPVDLLLNFENEIRKTLNAFWVRD